MAAITTSTGLTDVQRNRKRLKTDELSGFKGTLAYVANRVLASERIEKKKKKHCARSEGRVNEYPITAAKLHISLENKTGLPGLKLGKSPQKRQPHFIQPAPPRRYPGRCRFAECEC